MLFGGQILKPFATPEEWLALVDELEYSAVYFPVGHNAPDADIDAYAAAAKSRGLVIAEVGAWCNPISPNRDDAEKALNYCINQLALADRVGAACCVNVSGSMDAGNWAGAHPDNFTKATFDLIVATTQTIIDAVKPQNTYFTLEFMPWMYPHSADSYLELIKAINRERFAVHMDPVNIVVSPHDFYHNGALIRDCFEKLGPYIKSCHAKDIVMEAGYPSHLTEKRPGTGSLDYRAYVDCLRKYPEVPLMMEHMGDHEEVVEAAAYIRSFF